MLVIDDTELDGSIKITDKDEQYGRRNVKDCLTFHSPMPIHNKWFPVHEPEVELGYVQGVFAYGCNWPFFAKLWKDKNSGCKYVSLVISSWRFHGEEKDGLSKIDENNYLENEIANILQKSGLEVLGRIQDAETLEEVVKHISNDGIIRYASEQTVLNIVCCLCKDRDGEPLIAYTIEVTEAYEDSSMKNRYNLEFEVYQGDDRRLDVMDRKVDKLKSNEDFKLRRLVVKEVIDEWDPEHLLSFAPDDEYDSENMFIAALINENSDIDEIAEAVCHVFSVMFSSSTSIFERYTSEKCANAAANIKNELEARRFGIKDTSGRQKLADDKAGKFIVAGDWVYYTNRSDVSKIYKVRTDGMERQKLNDDRSWDVTLDGNWLYYQNVSDEDRIYRINITGAERQKINDDDSAR
jgi:hypothetical protein